MYHVWRRAALRVGIATAAMGCAGAAELGAQESGVRWSADSIEVRVGGNLQTQLNTTTADTEPSRQMLLRRAELEARVRVNRLVSGRVQFDVAATPQVRDAWIQIGPSPALQLLAGRARRPFSLLDLTSSSRILPIERGARLRGVTALEHYAILRSLDLVERDLGLQLLGSFPDLPLQPTYRVGVFAGPLQGQTGNQDTHQLAGRVTARLAEGVRIGAAATSRHFARPGALPGTWQLRRGGAVLVDLEYGGFAPGLHFLGEISAGSFDPHTGTDFRGAQGWVTYRLGPRGEISAIEPVLRVSYGAVDERAGVVDPGGLLVTPGANVYLGGRNRVMLNYDLWSPSAGLPRESAARLQFQLYF